ncbi:PA14 domain-containing protein [Cribrihabitans marinus]|uniref:PA14 domain-containing protein n=1 Tax=Cribrihabitans marinus TaxID=1227549 RepID=A0A1H7D3Z2_9RHOB|nr:PA14 domain-containing protein [Cribrihabitans marinus]GGH36701.1 hypothetical protein GCM10010973_30790 [Cribrihabitans marinus]SEJ93820.1 PA14 domain-containing protein [Cribrihabitans marinus]
MKSAFTALLAVLCILGASVAGAKTLKLTPAQPQPSGLKPGLSVVYAYGKGSGKDIKFLNHARSVLQAGAERGKPLRGLDYRDTNLGENTLTSKSDQNVAAQISGYIRFDQPGIYTLDFFTNDGLDARISGQRVGHFDGRQTCDSTYQYDVEVPAAGWYKFDATYFNRLNTSCLMMRWAPKGKRMQWVPNSAFGRK